MEPFPPLLILCFACTACYFSASWLKSIYINIPIYLKLVKLDWNLKIEIWKVSYFKSQIFKLVYEMASGIRILVIIYAYSQLCFCPASNSIVNSLIGGGKQWFLLISSDLWTKVFPKYNNFMYLIHLLKMAEGKLIEHHLSLYKN